MDRVREALDADGATPWRHVPGFSYRSLFHSEIGIEPSGRGVGT
jgi:hypothetical protein